MLSGRVVSAPEPEGVLESKSSRSEYARVNVRKQDSRVKRRVCRRIVGVGLRVIGCCSVRWLSGRSLGGLSQY